MNVLACVEEGRTQAQKRLLIDTEHRLMQLSAIP